MAILYSVYNEQADVKYATRESRAFIANNPGAERTNRPRLLILLP
jgi:hypothetical protein